MRGLFFIDDTVTNKISYWLLVSFLITLPFDSFYSEIILAAYTLHTCISCRKEYLKYVLTKEVLLVIAVYLLTIFTSFYSNDKNESISIITKQLAVFNIPVSFALNGLDLDKYKLNLLKFFVAICTITVAYLYFDALHTIAYFHLPLQDLFSTAFMNHNFSMPIEMHATYLSMYVAFSISVLVYLIWAEKNPCMKYLYIICVVILSAALLQLSSRAVVIALLLIINIAFPFFLLKGKQRIRFCIVSFLLSAALFFGIMQIDSFKTRYVSELKSDLSDKIAVVEIDESRVTRWEAIAELIKDSPVVGYGTGSEKKMLQDKYFEKKLYSSFLNQLNTHNEYLNFLLKAGFIGILIFICILGIGAATAWKQKDFLFAAILVLIAIVCVSENILDRNKGIFFYSFFFSLFLLQNKTPGNHSAKDTGNYD